MTQDGSEPPLHGIRVLELARILAGPWAGQLLADLGAEVIKIERPGMGDDTRHWGPPFVRGADGAELGAAFYHSCNRGKRSVAIDLSIAQGQDEVRALAAEADIVIENFKVGDLERYGLDAASLRARNPRLIYCSITGFGQDGPYAHRAGYDFIIQAMGGAMSMTGEPDGPPQKGGIAHADILTGVYSAVAILAALEKRHRTGRGSHIDMALLDTQVSVMSNQALNWMVGGKVPHRIGNGHVNLAPYQSFATADGDLVIAVGNDRQFAKLCAVLGRPELAADPRFSTNPGRVTHRGTLIPLLASLIVPWSRSDLFAALEAAGIPAGPINSVADAFADPQVVHRGLRLALPDGRGTVVPGVASPIVIDGSRAVSNLPAPPLDGSAARWRPR